jgi:hypothetical protein
VSVPINRGADPISQRVYALIFNGVTRASSSATDERDWIRLSERERIAEAVYAELRAGGIEIRLADGLEALREVSAQ